MASIPTFTSYANAIQTSSTTPYGFVADGLFVVLDCTSCILTLPGGGGTLNLYAPKAGTFIPIPSISVEHDGKVIALKVN